MKLKFILAALLPILFLSACKDTGQVGAVIQPDNDLLQVHSNKVYVKSTSMLVDSALSKSSYLFLGEYSDTELGRTQVEFMSQLDARLGFEGLTIPDTTVISMSSATTNGILNNLLTQFNSDYGNITKITSPHDIKVDSVFFIIRYFDNFFGDSTAIQGVKIYELNEPLIPSVNHRYYTNMDVSKFYKEENLLGELSYTAERKRELKIKLDNTFGERLAKIYQKGSSITTQTAFNEFFKGIYVSHPFNGGCIMQVSIAGIQLYYSYHADITTSYKGKETVVNSADLEKEIGINPLVSSIFLSANKAVERVNLVRHIGLKENFPALRNKDVTYTFTPAGMYTAVNIPFETMVDSIKVKIPDTTKVMFNSARVILYTKTLDWETELSTTPNPYMLLIHKDSVVPFFHNNKTPDGIFSFIATYNDTDKAYSFDITRAAQKKLIGKNSFNEDMVAVPIIVENIDNTNYYRQQLWLTATMLYGQNAEEAKRPRLDMVYTEWK